MTPEPVDNQGYPIHTPERKRAFIDQVCRTLDRLIDGGVESACGDREERDLILAVELLREYQRSLTR